MLASVLPSGSVSYLWYADRVFEFPLGVFAVALGTALLPSFASQAVRGAYAELRHSLSFSIRITNSIVLPATVGLIVLATPIVSVLFQRGAFGAAEVTWTAGALCAFAVGLWPVSMVRVLVPAFYAMENARTPVITAAGAFVANCAFSVLLMGPVAVTGESRLADAIAAVTQVASIVDLRHVGLALATSLSAAVNLLLLWVALRRRLGDLGGFENVLSFFRSAAASLAMIPAVRYVAALTDWTQPGALLRHAAVLVLAMAVGVAVFACVALLLGGAEVRALTRQIRQRLIRSARTTA
jgi:putative peptidoglycan lipid II flippase